MRAVGAAKFWFSARPRVEPLQLRQAPLLAAALCFATGELLARHWQPPALIASATAALFLLACIALARNLRVAALPVFATVIAAGCWCAQLQPPAPRQTQLHPYADGLIREVRGHVIRVRALHPAGESLESTDANTPVWAIEPGAWQHERGDRTQSVDLQLDNIEQVTPDTSTMVPITGGLRLTVIGAPLPALCGQTLEAPLRLRLPDSYRDPGAFSSADALLQSGIGALGSATSSNIHLLDTQRPSLHCRFFSAQSWASGHLRAYVDSRANTAMRPPLRITLTDEAILAAMLFGDRAGLDTSLKTGFERTGTFHLFVVSGLHVSLLAGGLLWLFARLRIRSSIATLATLPIITGYAFLTGFGVPVQRALLMTAAYLLARLFARQASALNALGLASLTVLVLDPRALYEASFQMTFAVIFAVAGLATPLRERTYAPYAQALHSLRVVDVDFFLHPSIAAFRVSTRMWGSVYAGLFGKRFAHLPALALRLLFAISDALLFGFAIELCMVIPMAIYFHRATLLGLPVNVVCIPLAAILLTLALAFFLGTLVSASIALPFAAITALCLHAVRWTIDHISHLALADIRLPSPAPLALISAAAALLFALWAIRQRRRPLYLAAVCAALFAPAIVLFPSRPLLHPGQLEVTAIDVGQGDSLFVASPDGHTMLIDAGGPVGGLATADRWDIGDQVVAPYLWTRRIARLDVIAITHAHSDHIGGMLAILRDLHPRELWLGAAPANSPALNAILDEAAAQHIPVRHLLAGDMFPWGTLRTQVLAPEADYTNTGPASNNDSLVLRLEHGRSSVILEGDAEAPSENAMLANARITPATLLKVAHHGSRTSSTEDFLAAAQPQAAIISVGRHNTFGHPRFDVLARLQTHHAKVFRTDEFGAQTFLLDNAGHIEAAQP